MEHPRFDPALIAQSKSFETEGQTYNASDLNRWQRRQRKSHNSEVRKLNLRFRRRRRQEEWDKGTLERQIAILEGKVDVTPAMFRNVQRAVYERVKAQLVGQAEALGERGLTDAELEAFSAFDVESQEEVA